MDAVIMKLISEMDALRITPEFSAILSINAETKYDDPSLVVVGEYPYMFVAPQNDQPLNETAGRAGYSVRALSIGVGLVINVADYFDPSVSESPGSRQMVKAIGLIQKRLRKMSKRNLDGLAGVRSVVVGATQYMPDVRNNDFVRLAVITLVVEKQYQHEE